MVEGFPLWSLASMTWEGREPLRDWICLSVSLCFRVPDSALSLFLIFPEIRNSDWVEIWTRFVSGYWLSCSERRAPTALRSGHEGPGRAWPPGARPLTRGPLGHRLTLILLPKNHKYSKKNLRPFLFRLDSVWYGVSAKHKTCNKQELALGTGSIC